MKLIDDIITLKHNCDYRIGDVVRHRGKGGRWRHSANEVLTKNKYNGSILQQYLKANGVSNKANFFTLLNIIKKYNQDNMLPVSTDHEIVVHLRLGDVVVRDWVLSKNYIKRINDILTKNENIHKLTFVTCFSYSEWSKESLHLKGNGPLWEYTEKKQKKNISKVTTLFQNIKNRFPTLSLHVYSNENIDKDFCYCVLAKHFIYDNGGFSELCHDLNRLNLQHNLEQITT